MISRIDIENYKSIDKLTLSLGRVNIFIGENGAGKSNILEAIALGSAASADKLDNEFLGSRGIRVTTPELTKSALSGSTPSQPIKITFDKDTKDSRTFNLQNSDDPYPKWKIIHDIELSEYDESFRDEINALAHGQLSSDERIQLHGKIQNALDQSMKEVDEAELTREGLLKLKAVTTRINSLVRLYTQISAKKDRSDLDNFVIYSPENSSMRRLAPESQIEPLGINGEGLIRLISFYADNPKNKVLDEVKSSMKVLGWFDDFSISRDKDETNLELRDRFIQEATKRINHVSANEGFFFLLFYFLLFNSNLTPRFFAIDNIDASLNPKLCRNLVVQLVAMSKKNKKQTILTTHNPAILDGLDLNDDDQRLFVISRNQIGATRVKRIAKPIPSATQPNYKLSELFLRGALGGLPKGF